MKKDKIPSFKEDIDLIHVPKEKLNVIIDNIEMGIKQRRKRTLHKKWGYSVGAAVLALGLLVGSASLSPAMASVLSSIPLLGSIFSQIGDSGQKNVSKLDLTEVVGQSKTVNGITISLGEVFYDGTRFNVSYSIVSEKPIVEQYIDIRFKIDKQVVIGSMGIDNIIETPTEKVGFLQISPDWEDNPQPEDLNLELVFKGQSGEQWNFTNAVKKQNNKEINIGHSENRGDFKFTVNKVILGPGGLLLSYEALSSEKGSFALDNSLKFRVVDPSGKELKVLEGSKYDEDGTFLYEPINDTVNELTITPFIDFPKEIKDKNSVTVNREFLEKKNYKFDSFTVTIPR